MAVGLTLPLNYKNDTIKMAKKETTKKLKEKMLVALEKSMGIVTTACRMANVSRNAHYTWVREDDEYRRAVDDISEMALDFTESKLLKNIEKEKEASIFFHLKTKGKHRGYVERVENDLTTKGDSINEINLNIIESNNKRNGTRTEDSE